MSQLVRELSNMALSPKAANCKAANTVTAVIKVKENNGIFTVNKIYEKKTAGTTSTHK